jgi:hypothetical protein
VLAIGTDEAGLGPWVGPLTLAGVALEAPASLDCGRLWDALGAAVCAEPPPQAMPPPAGGDAPSPDPHAPLCVCDSKVAFQQDGGNVAALATLERTVLTFAALPPLALAGGGAPARFGALLQALGGPALATLSPRAPWACEADVALPLAAASPPGAADRLARALARAGVQVRAIRLRLLDAFHYNDRLSACGENKGTLMVEETVDLLRDLVAAAPGLPLQATCGRLGGRKFYGGAVGALGPVLVSTIEEHEHLSRYALAGALQGEIAFRVDADADHFLVALASMFAKYAREVYMGALNAWLVRRRPRLTPTAGYGPDGRRFIRQCKGTLRKAGLPLDALARRR